MMGSELWISTYHYVRDLQHSRYPGIKGLDTELFEEQLRFFKREFHVVTMEAVIDALNGGTLPDRALLLTFDDGYIDNFTNVMPLLHKYGMQGSFFIPGRILVDNIVLDVNKIHFVLATTPIDAIKQDMLQMLEEYRGESDYPSVDELYETYGRPTRYDPADVVFVKRVLQMGIPLDVRSRIVDRLFRKYMDVSEACLAEELYMNADQVRYMKDAGMFIGVHGFDHFHLNEVSKDLMQADLDRALEVMDAFIDRESWVMNYPYGDFDQAVIDSSRDRGCCLGLALNGRVADLSKDGRYEIPRLNCNDFPPKSERYRELERV